MYIKNVYIAPHMEKIIFTPENHRYIRESDGMELMSVSTAKKNFETTNWDHNCRKSAAQEYFGAKRYKELKDIWEKDGRHILEPEFIEYLVPYMDAVTFDKLCLSVRERWDEKGRIAREKGTLLHAEKENQAISDGFVINPENGRKYPTILTGAKEDGSNETTVESLSDLEDGFHPELILWYYFPCPIYSQSLKRDICGICGTSDLVFKDPKNSYVRDYKFTGEVLTDFPVKYKNFGAETHSEPWNGYYSTKLSGYKIQLNLYGWLLEHHGLPPLGLHVDNYVGDKYNAFPIPYDRTAAEASVNRIFTESL